LSFIKDPFMNGRRKENERRSNHDIREHSNGKNNCCEHVKNHHSAVVCHGGLGTVLASLAHSLPLVCVPLGREQPQNADAVVRVGAGVRVNPARIESDLRTAVVRAVGDLELRAGAARLALEIDELVGADAAVHALEQLLD
jgi:UDP:flavonoid glycosyltransferase YjiC (YdhE family)